MATVTVSVACSAGGTVSGGGTVSTGGTLRLVATPDTANGYVFRNWGYNNATWGSNQATYNWKCTQNYDADVVWFATFTKVVPDGPGTVVYSGGLFIASPTGNGIFTGWTIAEGAEPYLKQVTGKPERLSLALKAPAGTNYYAVAHFVSPATLTYDADGGTPTPEAQTSYGDVTLAPAPTKDGYAFAGWSIGGETYQPGDTYTLHEDATATALWIGDKGRTWSVEYPQGNIFPAGDYASVSVTTDGEGPGTQGKTYAVSLVESQLPVGMSFGYWTATGITLVDDTAREFSFVMPDAAVTLTAHYVRSPLMDGASPTVAASLDAASAAVVGGAANISVSYASYDDGSTVVPSAATPLRYGDTATFSAAAAPTGFTFAGWFNGSERVATSATYVHQCVAPVALVAKYKTRVTLMWQPEGSVDQNYGTLSLGGAESQSGSASGDVVLGETVRVGCAVTAESKFFAGWYDGSGESANKLEIGVDGGDYAPASATPTLYARVASALAVYNLALHQLDADDGNAEKDGLCAFVVSDNAEEADPPASPAPGAEYYTVTGEQSVSVRIYATGEKRYKRCAWVERPSGPNLSGATPPQNASPDAIEVKTIGADYDFYAYFAASTENKVRAALAGGMDDISKGTVSVSGGEDATIDATYMEQKFDDGETATITAVPLAGFKFVGWFSQPDGETPESMDASYSFDVTTPTTYYAKFAVDECSIRVWEGGAANKTMEWTSKVFVAPRPFDPVAARVDATGYPVALSVGTMSSPDAEPTRLHGIEVASQDGRRLPRMRPERFLRFAVEASHEVDAVVIGTNMAEVN